MIPARSVPPGAGDLAQVRRQGMVPKNRQVEVGLGWSWGATPIFGVVRVIVPDRDDPASFDWRFVSGLDVVVLARHEPEERIEAALKAIRLHRPRRLLTIHFQRECIFDALADREATHA